MGEPSEEPLVTKRTRAHKPKVRTGCVTCKSVFQKAVSLNNSRNCADKHPIALELAESSVMRLNRSVSNVPRLDGSVMATCR